MRYLLFILAFPLFVQADTKEQQCDRLKTMASSLEKIIQTKIVGSTCTDLPASGITGYDYRCKDLASIEMQLKSIDNEIAMLKGVRLLRDEAIQAKTVLDATKNKAAAIDASQKLYKQLKIAVAIEGLLKVTGTKKENLLTVLAKAPESDMNDVEKFKKLITSTCTKIGVSPDDRKFCDSPSLVDEEVLKEVNGLLVLGKKTERKFNDDQVKDLLAAIAIQDGDKPYSFTKMLNEVKPLEANAAFTDAEFQILSSIKINPKGEKYSFLAELQKSSKELNDTKSLSHAQALHTRFQDLFDSLKRREEWELKSKLSVVLNELKGNIPESAKAACAQARTLSGNAGDCLTALSANLPKGSKQQNAADDILLELKYGQNHITKLDQLMKDCAPNTEDMSLLAECSKYLDGNLEELVKKAEHLNSVKAKILETSSALLISRDLAVETIHNKGCMNPSPVIINCEEDLGSISREAVALSDAAGEIVLMYNKPAQVTDVDKLCKETPEGTTHFEEICEIAQSDETEKVTPPKRNDDYNTPSPAAHRNVAGGAWADLLGTLGQAAGTFFAPKQQSINPYASMMPYSPYVGQPRDIKNQIMDPYMVTGFGSYAPTSGLRPYSSVNSNVGVSSAYSFGSSTFFNSPVGW